MPDTAKPIRSYRLLLAARTRVGVVSWLEVTEGSR
jgi:hypothetical protein